jgi:predicted dehydrogenase
MTTHRLSRRAFVRRAAAAGSVPLVLPSAVLGKDASTPPSERIGVGLIAVGRQCLAFNLPAFMRRGDCRIAAICDPDEWRMKLDPKQTQAYRGQDRDLERLTDVPRTADFREVLGRDDVDAVMISSPDHWHVPMAILAARAGKHICCEKPLSLTIADGRRLADEVERSGVIFRTDSEFRGHAPCHRGCLLVLGGHIGQLEQIRMAVPNWNSSMPMQDPMPVPEDLDYDLWLGPAPEEPYHVERVHPRGKYGRPGWYCNTDYCNGALVNWGHHMADLAQWASGHERTGPVEITGRADFPPADGLWNVPLAFDIDYTYADGVRLQYHATGIKKGERPYIRFEGSDGWIDVQYGGPWLTASRKELLDLALGPDSPGWIPLKNEKHDFLDCIRTGKPTLEDVEVGHRATSLCHLGLIAATTGETLRFDPERERFIDNDAADRLLGPYPARQPWDM